MNIFAISDLHLALSVPDKSMDFFGDPWKNYMERIQENWSRVVKPEDLVLIPGDISWAKTLDQALIDLQWIDKLPGTKVLLRGNHDYWWSSLSQVRNILPRSMHVIQNDVFNFGDVTIGGARLWETQEFNYNQWIEFQDNPRARKEMAPDNPVEAEKIFIRELGRLELSLKSLDPKKTLRIALTHYPPIGPEDKSTRVSTLLSKYNIDVCVYGHLHNLKKEFPLVRKFDNTRYYQAAADLIDFKPVLITIGYN